jgi:hypothetical protein
MRLLLACLLIVVYLPSIDFHLAAFSACPSPGSES